MAKAPSRDARFQGFFRAHRDAVWWYCSRRLHRDEVADAVAEVFLVAWRKIDEAPDTDEALLWLYGVARNVVRNMRRSTRRRHRLQLKAASVGEPDSPGPEMLVVRRAEDRELLAAVARLGSLERELLRLRTWEELTLAEIAEVVGSSVRSVESRLARTRRKLAAMLSVSVSSAAAVSPRSVEEGGEV